MNLPLIPVAEGATLCIYFTPSVFALIGLWSSKSQSEDMSPVCGNVTAEGWWFTAPQHDLILWCQRAQMPQRWGGANIMESTQPSVWDISWFGISSSAPAGGPYVDLRLAGESGCEAALRVKFPSMAPAVPGTAFKRGVGTTFKPYSSIHVPLPRLLHHRYLFLEDTCDFSAPVPLPSLNEGRNLVLSAWLCLHLGFTKPWCRNC